MNDNLENRLSHDDDSNSLITSSSEEFNTVKLTHHNNYKIIFWIRSIIALLSAIITTILIIELVLNFATQGAVVVLAPLIILGLVTTTILLLRTRRCNITTEYEVEFENNEVIFNYLTNGTKSRQLKLSDIQFYQIEYIPVSRLHRLYIKATRVEDYFNNSRKGLTINDNLSNSEYSKFIKSKKSKVFDGVITFASCDGGTRVLNDNLMKAYAVSNSRKDNKMLSCSKQLGVVFPDYLKVKELVDDIH